MSPSKRRCELMTSVRKRQAANRVTDAREKNFPAGIARPALRALAGARLIRLEDLQHVTRDAVAELHGMGPRALQALGRAMNASGLRFRDERRGA